MTKLCFASMEQNDWISKLVDDRLVSFFYKDNLVDDFWTTHVPRMETLIVDSGYFSLTETQDVQDPEAYVDRYCQWVQKHKGQIDHFVELDAGNKYGWTKQLKFREIFDDYGLDPMYVWHPHNERTWEQMCKDFDTIGLGSSARHKFEPIAEKLRVAEEYDAKVHIFKFTSPDLLNKCSRFESLYSVDSSSWASGSKYGQFYKFEKGKLRNYSAEQFINKYGEHFNELDYRQIDKFNARQWARWARHVKSRKGGKTNEY